jgi:oxaloacetate decarboxylase alpha subunit
MNDVETDLRVSRIAKRAGAEEVLVGLVYSISPVHTDAFYAARATEIAACADVDVLCLKDPGGLLTPERARALVPALRAAAPGLPLEVHSHCTATMAPLVYLEAARLGAAFLCTAVRPLANGSSQPSAEATVANLRDAGFTTDLDEDALAEMSASFAALAARIGRPQGVPAEYDAAIYRHQLPGGMTSTLRRQLREVGQEGRWDEVLAEIPRVREELGWPIMVTPLSQFVGVQAFLNVTTGARYAQIPDEVVKYVLGQYGPPPGELDPDVAAAVLASPKAEQLRHEPNRLDLADARARFGDGISDELLLLRMMLPTEQVDAMLANRRAAPPPAHARHPIVELVEGLAQRGLRELDVTAPGVRVRAR